MKPKIAGLFLMLFFLLVAPAQANILITKHNLSSYVPADAPSRTFYSQSEDRVCVFCHTPHNAKPSIPLWNHGLSTHDYTPDKRYLGAIDTNKSSLENLPGQPSNSSRLCLSCHDGTIAVGDYVGAYPDETGLGNMTSSMFADRDLSDDHPISIVMDTSIGNELVDPQASGDPLAKTRLEGPERTVECGSCHDAHDNSLGSFLRRETTGGRLCLECHRQDGWDDSAHANAPQEWNGKIISDWACLGCHTVHGALKGTRLLRPSYNPRDGISDDLENDPETGTCLNCHNGSILEVPDIRGEFRKTFKHGVVGDPAHYPDEFEDGSLSVTKHVECVDCHDSHRVRARTAVREIGFYIVGPELEGVVGLKSIKYGSAWTAPTAEIGRLYAVEGDQESGLCLKCHGSTSPMSFGGHDYMKAIDIFFNPNNWATHGSIVPNNNRLPVGESYVWAGLVPELRAKWPDLIVACSDCHGNDDTGDNRVWGPHGSNWGSEYLNGVTPRWLLRKSIVPSYYADNTAVPADTDAIVCYLCHDINVYGPRNLSMSQSNSNNEFAQVPEDNKRSGFWFHGISQHYKSSKVKYPPGVPNISCFACHGDYSDIGEPFGSIKSGGLHGAHFDRDDRLDNPASNTSPVHFLNGFAIEANSPDADFIKNSGTVSCGDFDFMVDGVSVGCNKHSSLYYTRRGVPELQ